VGSLVTLSAAVAASASAATGAGLIYSATGRAAPVVARRSLARRPSRTGLDGPSRPSRLSRQALDRRAVLPLVPAAELATALTAAAVAGAAVGYLLFDALAPAALAGILSAGLPFAGYRRRGQDRIERAAESWPRLLEEIRLRAGSLGRSVPQALFESARHAPEEWRAAFDAAEREWLLTVDFQRTVGLLKSGLADPTADAVCETLLLAHEIGGSDLDGRLAELIEDRTQDVQNRRDAASRLAGVRFARRFVLLVPLGMAVAGLTIGSGRHAYATAGGQVAVVAGLLSVAVCWWWSGRLMRMPGEPRVFL